MKGNGITEKNGKSAFEKFLHQANSPSGGAEKLQIFHVEELFQTSSYRKKRGFEGEVSET